MKILRVLSADADETLAQRVRDAVASFNRGLDIRLRFLSIVVEDRELFVDDAESAAAAVGAALAADAPAIVLVQGDDTAALAAATLAARGERVVAHLGAGSRSGPHADVARAIDRICGLLLAVGDGAHERLAEEGLGARAVRLVDGPEIGNQVIKAVRAERVRRRGDATC